MKTSNLIGSALDWAVAKCEDKPEETLDPLTWECTAYPSGCYNYSTNWSQGGPILEREFIAVFSVETRPFEGQWAACVDRHQQSRFDNEEGDEMYTFYPSGLSYGPTPLVAAMRCFVEDKLGDEIDIPKALT